MDLFVQHMHKGNNWWLVPGGGLTLFILVPQLALAQVLPSIAFSEIMYDAPGSDSKTEWVEVYNNGLAPVTIPTGSGSSSWRFYDGSYHTVSLVSGTTTIDVGAFAIIADDASQWQVDYPGFVGNLFDSSFSLKNTSSTVGLAEQTNGPLFTSVSYDSSWGAGGNGFTLEKKDVTIPDDSFSNWREGVTQNGTPGFWTAFSTQQTTTTQTSTATTTDPIIIAPSGGGGGGGSASSAVPLNDTSSIRFSELLPNPVGDDKTLEWIELYNESDRPVELAGMKLQDTTTHIYTLSEDTLASTIVGPRQYFVIMRPQSGISLNNTGGDALTLYSATDQIVDTTAYLGAAPEGSSWARVNNEWQWTTASTKGSENQVSTATASNDTSEENASTTVAIIIKKIATPTIADDDLIITEFVPNPDGADTNEWVEIKNATTTPIDLTGWSLDDADKGSKPYRFPDGVTLAAGEYHVFPRGETKLSLGNSNDAVRLLAPDGHVWQSITYDTAKSGYSYSFDEIVGEWSWTKALTPGAVMLSAQAADNQQPVVAGYEATVITDFDMIDKSMVGTEVTVQGVVAAPVSSVKKNTVFIMAADEDQGQLFEIKVPADRPPLSSGDLVAATGIVRSRNNVAYVNVADASGVIVIKNGQPLPSTAALDVVSADEYSWSSFSGQVTKANTKTLSVMSDEDAAVIHFPDALTADDKKHFEHATITATGLAKIMQGKPQLYLLSRADIAVADNPEAPLSLSNRTVTSTDPTTSPLMQWWYLGTVPVAAGVGWLVKRFLISRI